MIRDSLNSLRLQLVLLVIAALIIAQLFSLWFFADERSLAVRAALGFEAAGRAANVAKLIEEASPDLRESILRAANSPLVRFEIGEHAAVDHNDPAGGGVVESRIRTLLGDTYSRDIRVELHQIEGRILPLPHLSPDMAEMHIAMMRGELSAVEMNLSIALSGGQWLNVGTRFERPPLQWPVYSMVTFALTAAAILVAVFWFLLTQLTGPLRRLAVAAEKLGRGEGVANLKMSGPSEIRQLTFAFNQMHNRLTRFISDRTLLLAALGHDLRSPLTAMRVRSEMVDDQETRESLIASIEEMQTMVESTLVFARGMSAIEDTEEVNVQEFFLGLKLEPNSSFSLETGPEVLARFRPTALRRALRNVIKNAIRYGGSAHVRYFTRGDELVITVHDDGPGIPEAELQRVFEPFFRLETSRSLETGGYGLGLAIARTIIRGHGGDIALQNRGQGGLCVTITIPISA